MATSELERRRNKQLKGLGRAFRVTPTGTSKAAAMRSQAATSRAILGTRAAVQKIARKRGISAGAAASILRRVAAGTFGSGPRGRRPATPTSTRAGQVTRRGIVRGLREAGSFVVPLGIPGLGSTTTSRVRRRVRGAPLTAGRRVGGPTRTGGGRAVGAIRTASVRAAREVKRFGAGFFGR